MRAEYDRQLRELEEELFDMGSMCQQAVACLLYTSDAADE